MATRKTKPPPRAFKVSIDFEGKSYEATYLVQSGAVILNSAYGSHSTQVGANAEMTARMLFREILEGAKARGKLPAERT